MSDQIRCALKKENNTKQTETRLVVKRKLHFFILFHIFFEKVKYLHFYLAMSAEKWNSFPVEVWKCKTHTYPFVQTCSFCELLFNFDWKFLLFSLNSIWLSVLLNIKDNLIAWWIVNKLTSLFISKKTLVCVDLTYCCWLHREVVQYLSEVHFL